MNRLISLFLAFCVLFLSAASAQPIYKSIDKNGNVTYSSAPIKSALKVISVAHPPAPDPREAGRARIRLREFQIREANLEKIQREQEREAIRQRQIEEYLALKRRIANRGPANVTVINRNPSTRGLPFWNFRTTFAPIVPAPRHWPMATPMPDRHSGGSVGLRMWNNDH
ncbi:MAG: DUF4124 domain-containing protein [Methylococcales bacterium]